MNEVEKILESIEDAGIYDGHGPGAKGRLVKKLTNLIGKKEREAVIRYDHSLPIGLDALKRRTHLEQYLAEQEKE